MLMDNGNLPAGSVRERTSPRRPCIWAMTLRITTLGLVQARLKVRRLSTHRFDTNMSDSKAENIFRQQAIHEDAPIFTYGYFYCNEKDLPTKNKSNKP